MNATVNAQSVVLSAIGKIASRDPVYEHLIGLYMEVPERHKHGCVTVLAQVLETCERCKVMYTVPRFNRDDTANVMTAFRKNREATVARSIALMDTDGPGLLAEMLAMSAPDPIAAAFRRELVAIMALAINASQDWVMAANAPRAKFIKDEIKALAR